MLFSWLKTVHVIAIIVWFSGLFYLPRLFVYHAMTDDVAGQNRFKMMERKLYYAITTPGMWLVLLSGASLLWLKPALLQTDWLRIKLFFVLLLVIYHHCCGYFLQVFASNNNQRSHVFYRFFNEIPSLLLIVIVGLAIIQP